MAAGAQIANFKDTMMDSLPSYFFNSKLDLSKENVDNKEINSVIIEKSKKDVKREERKEKKKVTPFIESSDRFFPCMGITCSFIFTSKTNLQPSQMPKNNNTYRRCINMNQAILVAQSIEKFQSTI